MNLFRIPPSTGHAKRITKMLRAETWRQARLLQDGLKVRPHGRSAADGPGSSIADANSVSAPVPIRQDKSSLTTRPGARVTGRWARALASRPLRASLSGVHGFRSVLGPLPVYLN
ncbi:hypothetical protein HPB47_000652 [Ixodes persulcatus]|uniref:Uncharacterized protein n=1 Tax=Ixodes persulcatus TaxID=34615 RepID=A0AC60PR60_IXOPE|nr:hypothetical protein HPB47_000652 [Ixodes persulcatus]